MRLVLISDTHNRHNQVELPDGDILIHAGDLTIDGSLVELKDATDWLNAQPHKHKIAIAGNHDWACYGFYKEGREDILQNDFFRDVHYLRDSGITIDGVNFWGSPWTPEFFNWAFNLPRGAALREKWNQIPDNTDVLITHGPPAGVMDYVRPFQQYTRIRGGCDDLMTAVRRVIPKVHVFGHIHSGRGEMVVLDWTSFFNASIVDEAYHVKYEPFIFDVEKNVINDTIEVVENKCLENS